jgi:cholesterol oxidase
MDRLSLPVEKVKSHYEIAVIGSGYGGGVAASRLARAGRQVAVFERGKEMIPGEYPSTFPALTADVQVDLPEAHIGSESALFDFRFNSEMNVIVGCGLGGTSLINANISLQPDQQILADTHWPEAVRQESQTGELSRYFERAASMLGANPYPDTAPVTEKLAALERVAQRWGKRLQRPPINVTFQDGPNAAGIAQRACIGCGDCVSGCNHMAKNTVLMNYLPDAARHGAEIFTLLRLDHIERDGSAWKLLFRRVRGLLGPELPPIAITAETVVLAAGTLGSTEILLRSRDHGLRLSGALGSRFSGNGDMIGFAYNSEQPMNAIGWGDRRKHERDSVGPCSTGLIDLRDQPDGEGNMMVEACLPGALAVALPEAFAAGAKLTGVRTEQGFVNFIRSKFREWESVLLGTSTGAMRNTVTYLVVSRDDSGGQLYLEGDRIRVSWPGAGAAPAAAEASALIRRAAADMGGTFVRNPVWNRLTGNALITGHPLGGCIMGDDAAQAVVNHQGQVYSGESGGAVHPGLLVVDGAVIPRSLGVNPLLTITALAERSCAHFAQDHGWTIPYEPLRPLRMSAGRP